MQKKINARVFDEIIIKILKMEKYDRIFFIALEYKGLS